MTSDVLFCVTDVELDGLDPRQHSMISLGSVAVRRDVGVVSEFCVNLAPRADRVSDPQVTRWWRERPQMWAAATRGAVDAAEAMLRFCKWVRALPAPRAFAARPLLLDGLWVDAYLKDFCGAPLFTPPWRDDALFVGAGLDIGSYLEGAYHWKHPAGLKDFDPEEMGGHAHTHGALDDARGYAHLLLRALRHDPNGPAVPD